MLSRRKQRIIIACFLCSVGAGPDPSSAQAQGNRDRFRDQFSSGDPEKLFKKPPPSARPGVLWMWMGTNITREGITKDLEALKAAGFGRTTLFSLADITTPWACPIPNSPTPGIISWTEPWWKLVEHAAKESKRLGLDFGMFNGPSYESSGGKWITPDLSMQEICWSKLQVSGGQTLRLQLARPVVPPKGKTPFPIFNGETGKVEIPDVAARNTYYRDITVLALPVSDSLSPEAIIPLSAQTDQEGKLVWEAPPGEWVIYRFGHTCSGTYIQPAQWEATGLECDKMNPVAVQYHIDHVINEIRKHLRSLTGTTFSHVHFDSYEAGYPGWTPAMPEEFRQRRGYEIWPWLPLLAGVRVGSRTDSIRFRNDFDATVKDLHRDVYFRILAERIEQAGLEFMCEPYGGPWRQEEIMPLIKKVMTEFWTKKGKYAPYELLPTVAALRKSGQNIVEAEAFTGGPDESKWDETPFWLKPIGDAAFCDGVNRLVLHRFVHQPFGEQYLPGATMGRWGTHFDRTQTWWKPARAMIQYWQRCQALLQWGNFVPAHPNHLRIADTNHTDIRFIHRRQQQTDIYFIANTSRQATMASLHIGHADRQPEYWDPVTGEIQVLKKFRRAGNELIIDMDFVPAQSFFLVFRKAMAATAPAASTQASIPISLPINGTWHIQFDPRWGGPAAAITEDSLKDWTTYTEKGIRYYSGTATYQISFDITNSRIWKASDLFIQLGIVDHIAALQLNGKDIGVIWTAPWECRIPAGILKQKGNLLRISVTNVWANRLIGDEQEDPDMEWLPAHLPGGAYLAAFPDWMVKNQPRPSRGRYCFTTWNYFTKKSPLVPSGLKGPVRILAK